MMLPEMQAVFFFLTMLLQNPGRGSEPLKCQRLNDTSDLHLFCEGGFQKCLIRKSKLTQRQIYSAEAQSYPDTQTWIKAVGRHGGIADERATH